MKKFKYYFDLDKEEKWLNDLAEKGWILSGKKWRYTFNKVKDENRALKIDYRTFKSKKDWEDYILLFRDSGWKLIAGTYRSRKHYFEQIDEQATEDIFSNAFSKAERYKRMSELLKSLAIAYFLLYVQFLYNKSSGINLTLNPKSFFYTPGLWELSGSAFWKAFLFESPFAFGRGFIVYFLPVLIIVNTILAVKAHRHYKKSIFNSNFENQ